VSLLPRDRPGGPAAAAAGATRHRTPAAPGVFTVQRLDRRGVDDDDDNDVIAVHEISRNIFVASTQFQRPFDYSTSTWSEPRNTRFFIFVFIVIFILRAGYNYDSTSSRLQFEGATTVRRSTLRL